MLKIQTRLKHRKTGEVGTTCPTHYALLSDGDGPISIVFDGEDTGASIADREGTVGVYDETDFEVLGPEAAVVDDACGLGKGALCCVYATMGPNGLSCDRFTELGRGHLMHRNDMGAKRKPTAGYPECKSVAADAERS